jgi:hypothetical protein
MISVLFYPRRKFQKTDVLSILIAMEKYCSGWSDVGEKEHSSPFIPEMEIRSFSLSRHFENSMLYCSNNSWLLGESSK